jgi:hypothetical protein
MKRRSVLVAMAPFLALALAGLAQAREKPIPKEVDKFTAYMAERFAKESPDAKVAIEGPLRLGVTLAQNDDHSVYLNAPWDFCERDRRHCRREVDSFVTNMSGSLHETAPGVRDITLADIRVVVRGPGYVEELRQVGAGHPELMAVFRPVAGDLWMICVGDRPHGVQTLNHKDIARLGLTEDQTIALGLKNLATTLPSLAADTHVLKKMGLTFAAGDFYESSRMLLHEAWADMSRAMHGHLVVAVPESDVIIYGNGGGNGDREVLSPFAQTVAEKAPKPISVSLFQWTPTGWEVVTP